jgi:hypothetical protein
LSDVKFMEKGGNDRLPKYDSNPARARNRHLRWELLDARKYQAAIIHFSH